MADHRHDEPAGSTFETFLDECGIKEEVYGAAIKGVLAWDIEQTRRSLGLSKSELAARMETSRTQLERVLDPANVAVSLETLDKAARALEKRLEIRLVDAPGGQRLALAASPSRTPRSPPTGMRHFRHR